METDEVNKKRKGARKDSSSSSGLEIDEAVNSKRKLRRQKASEKVNDKRPAIRDRSEIGEVATLEVTQTRHGWSRIEWTRNQRYPEMEGYTSPQNMNRGIGNSKTISIKKRYFTTATP